jgi:TP53 regulating kinase-like protein
MGVSTPIIYDIDLKKHKIIMEYIDGPRVKDMIPSLNQNERESLFKNIGHSIGLLHNNNIVHGDLTTSNILHSNNKLYFIDFSLGDVAEDIEAKGVDIHLLMEAFESTHPEYMDEFKQVLDGYGEVYNRANEVVAKIDEIVRRGRYTHD